MGTEYFYTALNKNILSLPVWNSMKGHDYRLIFKSTTLKHYLIRKIFMAQAEPFTSAMNVETTGTSIKQPTSYTKHYKV